MTQVSPSPERPLVEAIAELQDADPESLAALIAGVDDRVDAAVSTRSSHDDPDPQGRLDAAVSTRSSHDDPDPQGRIGSNLDAAVSSRSSHEWDPDGVLPSGTTVASVDDVGGGGTDWASKTFESFNGAAANFPLTISGSGFLIGAQMSVYGNYDGTNGGYAALEINRDNTSSVTILQLNGLRDESGAAGVSLLARFENEITITSYSDRIDTSPTVSFNYVLD